MTNTFVQELRDIAGGVSSRFEFWQKFINRHRIKRFAEIGVWKGEFAEHILKNCASVERYYMIDPWQHLKNWNKPANVSDIEFDTIFREAMARTDFAGEKRKVLRCRMPQAMAHIGENELDAAYIDGDHTLRGIAIDLTSTFAKVRTNGFIGGDDFCPNAWQHPRNFEPTLVFPFAVHFAEATGCPICALPFNQFLIIRNSPNDAFSFMDLTGRYGDTSIARQIASHDMPRRALVSRIWARLSSHW